MNRRGESLRVMAPPIAPDYGQQFLFPPALEDWVPADHPARFIREFVEQLDLPALGFALPTAVEGRPPYAPSLFLKIWLYGYFQRIRSTRKLEAACCEHLALLWLTGLIAPDHNSLWRFWRDNKKALRQIFKQTVQLAVRTGAVGLALQALDGTKIQAACSGPHGWRKEYLEKLLAQLDAALDELELEVLAENAQGEQPGYRLPAGLAQRQALRQEIQKGLAQLQADERNHYHRVEPEARRMKIGDTNRYAYNAQVVVDAKQKVIVACEASRQETDVGQLVPLVEQAREKPRRGRDRHLDRGRHRLRQRRRPAGRRPQANERAGSAVRRQTRQRQSLRCATLSLRSGRPHRHLPAGPEIGSRRSDHQTGPGGAAVSLSPPRLSGARAMHARPQRPAD